MLPVISLVVFAASAISTSLPVVFDARGQSRFDRIQVFGDSLSDNGTGAFVTSNGTWPADSHYYGHRFSNGRVYAEVLAASLGVPISDCATGGATTNNALAQGYTGPGSAIPVPSILDQISTFSSLPGSTPTKLRRSLFIVYGGANDAFFGLPNVTAAEVVENLKLAVKRLKAQGATHFLLPTLPPLGKPYPFSVLTPSYSRPLARFSLEHREALLKFAKSDPTIVVVNYWALFSSFYKHPSKYGFDPKTLDQSCLRGVYGEMEGGVTVCDNPKEYLWWDEYHPTTIAHSKMAGAAVLALKTKGWLE